MTGWLEAAGKVSSAWSLAAFAIAAVLYFLLQRRRKTPPIAWAGLAAIVALGLVPILGSIYGTKDGVYRVRVTVLDPQKVPVEDARVWSSIGGEPKRVAGGWQFDIPSAAKPADGKLTVYASVPNAFLTGRQDVALASDFSPALTVQLARDASATVRGIVVDESGRAVAGARVSVVGYGSEAVTTTGDGSFVLPAHSAKGQQVQLHAEKAGLDAITQWHPAGDDPATLVLGGGSGRR